MPECISIGPVKVCSVRKTIDPLHNHEIFTSRLADDDSMFVTSLALMKSSVFVIKRKMPPPVITRITKNQINFIFGAQFSGAIWLKSHSLICMRAE